MKTQDTNFNPKMSSEPLEEKPFLKDLIDAELKTHPTSSYIGIYRNDLIKWFYAAEKANARISELDKEVKQACIIIEDLNMQLASLESELKELRGDLAIATSKNPELLKAESKLSALLGEKKTCVSCEQEKQVHEICLDCAIKLGNENSSEIKALREERDKAIEIVKSLADWSRRYPRDRVYPMNKISMDNELIELEERAKAYTLNTEKN